MTNLEQRLNYFILLLLEDCEVPYRILEKVAKKVREGPQEPVNNGLSLCADQILTIAGFLPYPPGDLSPQE